jgi:hypothetical protein
MTIVQSIVMVKRWSMICISVIRWPVTNVVEHQVQYEFRLLSANGTEIEFRKTGTLKRCLLLVQSELR